MANTIGYSLEKILATLTGSAQKQYRASTTVLVDIANALIASATKKGIVELATSAEAITGTDTERAVTPAALAASIANQSVTSTAFASVAEAKTGTSTTKMVNPADLKAALLNVRLISFAGVAAAGPCTAVGLVAGDVVISVQGIAGVFGNHASNFEAAVTVNDQLQQSAATLSANKYMALIYRPSGT